MKGWLGLVLLFAPDWRGQDIVCRMMEHRLIPYLPLHDFKRMYQSTSMFMFYLVLWIRICIKYGRLDPDPQWECGNVDPDPELGGQKLPTKKRKVKKCIRILHKDLGILHCNYDQNKYDCFQL
jgi:hypothetical protein